MPTRAKFTFAYIVTVTRRQMTVKAIERKRALMGVCRRVILSLKSDCYPVFEIDHQMHQDATPVTDRHRPSFSDLHGHQIELL